jgi:hypothetical protein
MQLVLEGTQESFEEIQKEPGGGQKPFPQMILHQGAEDDRPRIFNPSATALIWRTAASALSMVSINGRVTWLKSSPSN